MHCLLVHQAFLGPNGAGGTRHLELARYCVVQGHEFTVIASDVSYLEGRKQRDVPKSEVIDGVRVIRATMPAVLHKSFFWRGVAFVCHMLSSFWWAVRQPRMDLVMGTSPSLFQALAAYCVSVVRRKPFLLEIRDLWPDFAIEMGVVRSRLLIYVARKIEHLLYRRSRHIVVNSPAYAEYLFGKGVPRDKVTLISNGVDPTMFDPQETGTSIRTEYQLGDRFVVVYAGAIGAANDIPTIIHAARRLAADPSIHFLLVGDGSARRQILALIAELGLTNVTWTAIRPKNQMKAVLGAADACVATLRNLKMFRTTYPNKVFDYMAAGRPTLLGIDGVIRDVIEAAQGGLFVTPGDDAELADKIRWLKQNPEQARQMGLNARRHVVRHFHRADQAAAFESLLRELVPEPRVLPLPAELPSRPAATEDRRAA